jgi:predicted aspartyl protease
MSKGHSSLLLRSTFFCLLFTFVGCERGAKQPTHPRGPLPPGQQAVQLIVVRGAAGNTLAFVPVYINKQGPFKFTLDTGASESTIDWELAQRLALPADGDPVTVTGVGSVSEAIPVRVEKWRLGKDVELPSQHLVMLHLAVADRKSGIQGLLGSDVLSQFGAVLVDYNGQVLVLHPKRATGK